MPAYWVYRAFQALWPVIPSTVSPAMVWNCFTACTVAPPYRPSTVTLWI